MTLHEMPLQNMPERQTRRQLALDRARQVLSAAGVRQPPVDIVRLARLLGVRWVRSARLGRTAACLLPGRNGHTILVSEKSSPRRRRFSIAHELGHLILRAHGLRFRDSNRVRNAREEKLCDEMAAELLMPTAIFQREMWGTEGSLETISDLSTKFDTAIEPTAIRFGLLSRNEIEVIYWERQRDCLRAKWVAGKRFIPRNAVKSLSDMTSGPVGAYYASADDLITTYESRGRSGSDLDLGCQSRAWGANSYRFVLSLIRQESYGKEQP